MGARAQVHIKDTGVYLYTHWGAGIIEEDIKNAIARGVRWDDPEYLARIIFDQMKGINTTSELGFGIGTSQHGDIEKLITVSCKEKTVRVLDIYEKQETSYTFKDAQ